MVDAKVYQLGRGYGSKAESKKHDKSGSNGDEVSPLRTYKFIDIWPVSVSDIALSYDTGDTIEEFTVEFAVQNIEIGSNKDQNKTMVK